MAQNCIRSVKAALKTQHEEVVVVCAIQIEQLCSLPKLDVKQRSFLGSSDVGTVFLQLVFKQACCSLILSDASINAAFDHGGNHAVDDRVPRLPDFYRTEGLFTLEVGSDAAKQLKKTQHEECGRGYKLHLGLFWRSRGIYAAVPTCEAGFHNLRFLWVKDRCTDNTTLGSITIFTAELLHKFWNVPRTESITSGH